jgi:hypothetical protein
MLAAARRRLEAGHGMAGRPLRVSLSNSERDQVGRLLGTSWVLSGRQVGAKALAEAVASLGTDLEALLTSCGGPVRDRAAERAASLRQAEDERGRALDVPTSAGVPDAAAAAWMTRRGLPRAGTGQLLELASRCALVWPRLPGPTVLLTVLAGEALGDPHALDRGSPVAAGVLRLLGHDTPATAEAARRLLAALAGGGTVLHVRADEDSAGRQIVSGMSAAVPGTTRLWRYSLEPSPHPRYEEQDLELLLHDLDRG